MITELKENEVFVFGSNLQGMHAGGAAKQALDQFGAIYGKGVGRQGQCYAIPTMGGLQEMHQYIIDFKEYALLRPDLTFLVTPIGTGIAGRKAEDIAPMFKNSPDNVVLPDEFSELLTNQGDSKNE